MTGPLVLVMFDSSLDADGGRHFVNAGHIERSGETDGFGKFGNTIGNNAVQGFAPPIVRSNIQARDRTCLIHKLRGLFFERHAVNEIGRALFRSEFGIQIGIAGRLLRKRGTAQKDDARYQNGADESVETLHLLLLNQCG